VLVPQSKHVIINLFLNHLRYSDHFIWCVLLLLSFIIVIVIIIIMTITITIIITTTYYYYYAWRLPPSSPAHCPACHMPACRHFTSHEAYASNPWQKKLSGKLDSMVRVYCPAGALAAGGVLQPLQRWITELQDAQNLIPGAPGAPGVLQQLQLEGKRTNTCMHPFFHSLSCLSFPTALKHAWMKFVFFSSPPPPPPPPTNTQTHKHIFITCRSC
jgi:hypothetical protein